MNWKISKLPVKSNLFLQMVIVLYESGCMFGVTVMSPGEFWDDAHRHSEHQTCNTELLVVLTWLKVNSDQLHCISKARNPK